MDENDPKILAESLQNLMVAIGRGGNKLDPSFQALRSALLEIPELRPHMPSFVQTCRNGMQFWGFIKSKAHYHERDTVIWDGFRPVFNCLESRNSSPAAEEITQALKVFDSEHVQLGWQRALARRATDPEAALTSARSLLESTCKHILDSLGEAYVDTADLPDLYGAVAKALRLSPSQHTEQIFRQILGGCHSVVQGLGSLRNRLGDAHGKGLTALKPRPRHAALAVNLAGAMSLFLVETLEARKQEGAS